MFVKLGFFHILQGIDHLLFLLCLVIPFRRLWGLLSVITSFTVAHSITLIAAAYGVVPEGQWFPPLVEVLIALSIFYMAIENIIVADLGRRWLITGAFGLVHGFAFSFALHQDLQFAGSHILLSLLSFNIGVELGQIMFLVVAVPLLVLLFRHPLGARWGVVVLSVLLAHTAWHWMLDRAQVLQRAEWPTVDIDWVLKIAGWLLIPAVGWAVWFGWRRARPLPSGETAAKDALAIEDDSGK